MDKGIRIASNRKFAELLPTRENTRKGNAAFRKAVMDYLIAEFDCTVASAATHYNHSFQDVKKHHPEQVEGLGRPEDKKGGRKPKAKPTPAAKPADPIMANMMAAFHKPGTAAVVEETKAAEEAPQEPAAPVLCTVVKAKDGSVVAEGLTREQAEALVAKAAAGKKAKLEVK